MRSEHFEVRVCGLRDGVELGLFRHMAPSSMVPGEGFVEGLLFGKPLLREVVRGKDFRERVAEVATRLLKRAESAWLKSAENPDSAISVNQRLAEEALKDAE